MKGVKRYTDKHCEEDDNFHEDDMQKLMNEITNSEIDEGKSGMGVCCSYHLIGKITNYICGNVTTPFDDQHVWLAKELIDPRMVHYLRAEGFGFHKQNTCVKAFYSVMFMTLFLCGDFDDFFFLGDLGNIICSRRSTVIPYRSDKMKGTQGESV
jgi:hypothetical protein